MILEKINNIIAGLGVNSKKLTRTQAKYKSKASEAFDTAQDIDLSKLSSDELKIAIAKRIKSLDQTNSNFHKKAITAFVEYAVAWEYGDLAFKDPSVSNTIESIVIKIENDAELKNKYITMLDTLRQKNY